MPFWLQLNRIFSTDLTWSESKNNRRFGNGIGWNWNVRVKNADRKNRQRILNMDSRTWTGHLKLQLL